MRVAAGTSPNVTYEKEQPGTFQLDSKKRFFQGFRAVKDDRGGFVLEPDAHGFFTSYQRDGRFVSYYGDNHPRYAGNVVKAMASAKHGYRHIAVGPPVHSHKTGRTSENVPITERRSKDRHIRFSVPIKVSGCGADRSVC